MSSYPLDPTSELEQLRRQLREADNTIEELRGKSIEALMSARERATLNQLRDSGASQDQIDAYMETRRIIRQSDAAKNRGDQLASRVMTLEQLLAKSLSAPTPTSAPAAASAGTIWAKLYTDDGYQISLTLPAASVDDALKHMTDIRAAGLLPAPVEPPSTEETETITTVVRREFIDAKGNAIPVIDCYPDWRGQYGQYRFTTIYLDTAADIAQFEAHAGVKLESLSLYDGQSPIMRKEVRPHRCEVKVKAFVVCKKYAGDKEVDGKVQRVFKFSHYVSADGYATKSAAKPADTPETVGARRDAPASAAPVVPTSMISANVQAALTNAIQAPANPFERPAVQAAIIAALTKAGLTEIGGLQFLFANILPGKTLTRVSDAYPDLSPDDFMKRLPAIGQQYRAHLEAQTQPDPDDDPTPSPKNSTPAPSRPINPYLESKDKQSKNKPTSPRAPRQRHPLEGEEVEIDRIEVARDRNNWKVSEKWIAHGTAISANGTKCAFQLNIWKEDARRIREAGYAIQWPDVGNDYAPCLTNPAPVVIVEMRSSGLGIASVQPAVHPARRESA